MNSSEFATLCGISRAMVSKYNADGLISMNGKQVDARASLLALEGRLNEDKRRRALEKLEAMETGDFAVEATPEAATRPRNGPIPEPTSHKARKDMFAALNAEMEYRRKAGELLLASDVAQQAQLAVEAMREKFSNDRRQMAQKLCAHFDLPPDRETAVVRFLSDQFEATLGRFGEVAAKLAEPAADVVKFIDTGDDHFVQADLDL